MNPNQGRTRAKLLKPPHLSRFLAALAAGIVAVVVYLTAEHFDVVPGTGALDQETLPEHTLGPRSIAIVPAAGDQDEPLAEAVTIELIGLLSRVEGIQVIAAQSALASAARKNALQKNTVPFDAAWLLRLHPHGDGARLSAVLSQPGGDTPPRTLAQLGKEADFAGFVNNVVGNLASELQFEVHTQVESFEKESYEAFLMARFLQSGGVQGAEAAEILLDDALERAPDWSAALAARAYGRLVQVAAADEVDGVLLDEARGDLERAILFEPDLAEAHLYRSLLAHRFDWDWQGAYSAAQRAEELAPGDTRVLAAAATAAFTLGEFDLGVEHLERAILLDPLAPSHKLKLGLMLEFGGQPNAAIDAYRELMVFDPNFPGAHAWLGRTLLAVGRHKAALAHMEVEQSPFWRRYGTTLVQFAMDRRDEAAVSLDQLIQQHGHEAAIQIAEIHAFAGQVEEAFEWLQGAVEQRDPGVAELVGNPLLASLRDDPRWTALLSGLGLPAN